MDDPIGKQALEVMSQAGWYNKWTFELFKSELGDKVLEIGSGIGNYTKMIVKVSKHVYATDIRDEYLKKLNKLKSKNIEVTFADIEKNKFDQKVSQCDSIVCLNVLEHIMDDLRALRNMRSKLKRGGRLLLLVPSHKEFFGTLDKGLGHYRRYNKSSLQRKLKQAGFKIERIKYINPIAGLGWFLNARVLKKKELWSGNIKIFTALVKPLIFLEKFIEPPFGLSVFVVAKK